MESSEAENRDKVRESGYVFLDKNSKTLPQDLRDAVEKHFGFGDFIVTDPATGMEVMRIHDLKSLRTMSSTFPPTRYSIIAATTMSPAGSIPGRFSL